MLHGWFVEEDMLIWMIRRRGYAPMDVYKNIWSYGWFVEEDMLLWIIRRRRYAPMDVYKKICSSWMIRRRRYAPMDVYKKICSYGWFVEEDMLLWTYIQEDMLPWMTRRRKDAIMDMLQVEKNNFDLIKEDVKIIRSSIQRRRKNIIIEH